MATFKPKMPKETSFSQIKISETAVFKSKMLEMAILKFKIMLMVIVKPNLLEETITYFDIYSFIVSLSHQLLIISHK